jgi:hypothetical protein
MKKLTSILLCLGVLILGLAIGYWLTRNEVVPPEPLNDYKVDTIYLTYPGIPPPLNTNIKPKTLIIYSGLVDSLKLIRVNDSLQAVIDSIKKDTVFIKDKFLTLFPQYPKLISMDLKLDSLSLTLLGIDAKLKGYIFPLQLNHYQYRWGIEGLSASPIPPKGIPSKSRISSELMGYAGYQFFSHDPIVGLIQTVEFSRISFSGDLSMTISNKPSLEFQIIGGIPIKTWGKGQK